jgi:hypothetical protein
MTNLSAPSRSELAHRSSDDIGVTLVRVADGRDGEEWDVACVHDRRKGAYFEVAAESYLAFDVYHHPFVYRDFSNVDLEHDHLAEAIAEIDAGVTQSGWEQA